MTCKNKRRHAGKGGPVQTSAKKSGQIRPHSKLLRLGLVRLVYVELG